jgi:hypothetical protein
MVRFGELGTARRDTADPSGGGDFQSFHGGCWISSGEPEVGDDIGCLNNYIAIKTVCHIVFSVDVDPKVATHQFCRKEGLPS